MRIWLASVQRRPRACFGACSGGFVRTSKRLVVLNDAVMTVPGHVVTVVHAYLGFGPLGRAEASALLKIATDHVPDLFVSVFHREVTITNESPLLSV